MPARRRAEFRVMAVELDRERAGPVADWPMTSDQWKLLRNSMLKADPNTAAGRDWVEPGARNW